MIIKRDGRKEKWDSSKVVRAIEAAYRANGDVAPMDKVTMFANSLGLRDYTVEHIQDIVEQFLMTLNPGVAKRFILYRHEAAKMRSVSAPNIIGDYIHIAKYARHKDGRRETWDETVDRLEMMFAKRHPIDLTMVRQKKVMPSMRALQFAGDAIEQHNARMYNCSFTLIDRPRVFQEILYLLLCGCGVGYSVQNRHVEKLPSFSAIDETLIEHHKVEDTIEGWANALGALVEGCMKGWYVEFDYSGVRPEGSPLNSGGKAPGHLPLKRMLEKVRPMLSGKLRPIVAHDIICHVAECVLAGGIRRSSLLALFSLDDSEMMNCKRSGEFDWGGKNAHRAMANNSVRLPTSISELDFLKLHLENGEPGFYFSDDPDVGPNPCGEIVMSPVIDGKTGFSFCNLTEVVACDNREEFLDRCRFAAQLGTVQATYNRFPYLGTVTEKIVWRDALLGVSITGMMDYPEVFKWLKEGYQEVKATNRKVAYQLGIRHAVRMTCIKPSGTASLLLGVSSGIHPHHAKRYWRRVTCNRNEGPARFFAEKNPHMVEHKSNGDFVLKFPIEARGLVHLRDVEFLGYVYRAYQDWVDHSVSCTVTVDDWGALLKQAWELRFTVKCLSFVERSMDPPFAPRETVRNADEWRECIERYTPVDWSEYRDEDNQQWGAACDGDKCEAVAGIVMAQGVNVVEGRLVKWTAQRP